MEGGEGESNLKGTLIDKAKPPESKLTGSLLKPKEILEPESQLQGTLLNKSATEIASVAPEDGIAAGMEFIQRDSGESFTVGGFTDTKTGKKINLINSKGQKITLSEPGFLEALGTEGSAWSKK